MIFRNMNGKHMQETEGRAQIMADDIGETLNFIVGFTQIGGAFVDG